MSHGVIYPVSFLLTLSLACDLKKRPSCLDVTFSVHAFGFAKAMNLQVFGKLVDIYTLCHSYLFLYIETGNGKVIT